MRNEYELQKTHKKRRNCIVVYDRTQLFAIDFNDEKKKINRIGHRPTFDTLDLNSSVVINYVPVTCRNATLG